MSARERMEQRQRQSARQRASERGSGYATTIFKMPEGLSFYKVKKGRNRLSFLEYQVGKGNPFAKTPGMWHWERTFYTYRKIGAEENSYVAPGKTAGLKDFIQEFMQEEARKEKANTDLLKALKPSERQAFLVFDHDEPEKKVQLFEFSFHKFGKKLDSRISNADEAKGWNWFFVPDDRGYMLEATFIDTGTYGLEVDSIDFEKRSKPLPDDVIEHGFCLDDMLIIPTYEQLKAIFLCTSADDRPGSASSGSTENRTSQQQEERREPPPERKQEEPPKQESKPAEVTAHQLGLVRDDFVEYRGKRMTVVRVSEDGLSLTLMDEEDTIHKPVRPADVRVMGRRESSPSTETTSALATTTTEPPKQESKPVEAPATNPNPPFDPDPKKDASSGEDKWDEDWK